MALSTGMATTGGAAVALNPGTALGGNALAAQQTFNSFGPPPSMGPTPDATEASHGGGRAGGAYDMRSWEQGGDVYEDLLACLGVDVGTSTIKVGMRHRPDYTLVYATEVKSEYGYKRLHHITSGFA